MKPEPVLTSLPPQLFEMYRSFAEHLLILRGRLKPAQEVFAVNLYRFAQAELEREKETGYPALELVFSQLSRNYRILLLNMHPAQRVMVLDDALRWCHRDAIELLGDQPPIAAPALHKELFEICLQPSAQDVARYGYLQTWDKPERKLKKSALWRALKPEMLRVTGSSGEQIPGGEHWYDTICGQWTVRTYLDTGGAGGLRIGHDIFAAPHLDLKRQISVLGLLGFPIRPNWNLAGAGEEESVARCVGIVCDRFIGELPRLLAGVEHDITSQELELFAREEELERRLRREEWKQESFRSHED